MRFKRMLLITNVHPDIPKISSHGLLGAQLAASLITANTPYRCQVLGVDPGADMDRLEKSIFAYFGNEQPVVGFSNLGGREELFILAERIRNGGGVTILGGPQAKVDFSGEIGWQRFPHRFHGWRNAFSLAVQGPGEQLFPILNRNSFEPQHLPGIVWHQNNKIFSSPPNSWQEKFLQFVDWSNLNVFCDDDIQPVNIIQAQVVGAIGCPWARRLKTTFLDYPANLSDTYSHAKIRLSLRGCSFCDVAQDKGFIGRLSVQTVMHQLKQLPEYDGKKIPFELIDENPLPGLPRLLVAVQDEKLRVQRIDLVTRADWLVKNLEKIHDALELAQKMDVQIRLASIGFESFSPRILKQFNKGITLETNLAAIRFMRETKIRFPKHFAYSRREGCHHGFIHPTPWDTPEDWQAIQAVIQHHGLEKDILPAHSLPLIIHHASPLGIWMRAIEYNARFAYPRQNSWIAWWDEPQPKVHIF